MNKSKLIQILEKEKHFNPVLDCIYKILKDDAMLCAGYIQQVYWNHCHGFPLEQGIRDIDICYFSPLDNEKDMINKFKSVYGGNIPLDIKNQAYVHIWYEKKYGYSINPYSSLTNAIDTFPTTSTTIGICKQKNEYELYSTFGLDDLSKLILKPNKRQITKSIYEKYCVRLSKRYPKVTIINWEVA